MGTYKSEEHFSNMETRNEDVTVEIPRVDMEKTRMRLIDRAEAVVLDMLRQICSNKWPSVSYSVPMHQVHSEPSNSSQSQDDSRSEENDRSDAEETAQSYFDNSSQSTTVDFKCKRSRTKLTLLVTVLASAHRLMITNRTRTKRSLYYDLQSEATSHLAAEQRTVDEAVNHVANLLSCAPWDLGFVATGKGLIAGNLLISLSNDEFVDCNARGGALIPVTLSNVTALRSNADRVIVVEKDSVFQLLLLEDCPRALNCILITGKGYPDVSTRMLVKMLEDYLRLPIYALVDADPFGVEIMCVYRFGSAALARGHDQLVCPSVKWLGVHPSELIALAIPPTPLTDADRSKLASLENRLYATEPLREELREMRRGKAEIEAIAGFSPKFLTAQYLPSKIKARDYI